MANHMTDLSYTLISNALEDSYLKGDMVYADYMMALVSLERAVLAEKELDAIDNQLGSGYDE